MEYQKQAFIHDPENGVYGDCYRTCIAGILGLERDSVPHFVDTMDAHEWGARVQCKVDRWLEENGLQELEIPVAADSLTDVLALSKRCTTHPTPAMLLGTSRSGCNHVVIIENGEIVHDPSITDAGIIGPADDGHYWITWIIPAQAGKEG